ncbi:MAG: hypothetical protein JSW16_06045 [Dehalococcoidales bacterium]|nr:MAG: hypothetical protein JSW16_06045 [Dehalococcoidales bacterium]
MPKCPNCGQETTRTQDWACQWCGFPLTSSSFKTIDKTFQQLKDERRPRVEPVIEAEPEIEVEPELEPEPEPEPKPKRRRTPRARVKAKPKAEPEPEPEVEIEIEPELEMEPEPEPEPKPKRRRTPRAKAKAKPKAEPEPEPEVEIEVEPELEIEPEPELELEPEPEPEPEPVVETKIERVMEPEPRPEPALPVMELTFEELLSTYEEEGAAADAHYANRLLKISGVVNRIEVKEELGIHYINLASSQESLLGNMRCVFDKQHASVLNRLMVGQEVTVQGTYDGSVIDMRMKDCVLV